MKKVASLLSLLILFNISVLAQNDYNKTDDLGRRQGKWVDYHDNGQMRYEGEFKNNEPIGEFLYYSEEGKLTAKMIYEKRKGKEMTPQISTCEMYSGNGNIIARGRYSDRKKHESWEYYSETDGALILKENYDNGVLTGTSTVFSPITHNITEETEYLNGIKNGICNKYYDNGRPMVKMSYKDDKLDGSYVSYYPNGVPKEEGMFKEGMKVGEWKTYDMEENVVSIDNFDIDAER